MGFTRLDRSIFQSNVMALSPKTFKVWVSLLASCDDDGIARVSPTYLARICYLSLKDVEKALIALSLPIHGDHRINRVHGGYAVIDYEKYGAK